MLDNCYNFYQVVININMRCIEMEEIGGNEAETIEININMRCIEIF